MRLQSVSGKVTQVCNCQSSRAVTGLCGGQLMSVYAGFHLTGGWQRADSQPL